MATKNRPGVGMLSWVGFGAESTYGTAVTPTNYVEITSETVEKANKIIEATTILRRGILNTRVIPGAIEITGDLMFPIQYDGWLQILYQGMGAVVHSQPDVTNAPTAYNHHFTMADQMPTGMTLEIFRDTTQFTTEPNKSFVYTGCKVDNISLTCDVDKLLEGKFTIMGQNELRAARSTSNPNTNVSNYAVFHQGTVKYNGNDLEVDKFTIDFTNGYARRPKLGSRLTREMVPETQIVAQGTFECEFQDWIEYDNMVNTTEAPMVVDFIGNLIQGAIFQEIKITLNHVFITKSTIVLNKPGRILMQITFKCFRDQTNNEVIVDVVNTNSTI